MDKNFVNIDDLVRQRLGGGEEQERSGAWLHMRDLLDKEMPQENRAGFIYWRRMLSAVAVLLLIATITVGGYELSANRNSSNTGNNDVAVATPVTKSTPNAFGAPAIHDETNKDQVTSAGIAANDNQAKNDDQDNKKQDNKKIIAANDSHLNDKQSHKHLGTAQKGLNNTDADNKTITSDQLSVASNVIASKENNPVTNNPVAEKSTIKKSIDNGDVSNSGETKEKALASATPSKETKTKMAATHKADIVNPSKGVVGKDASASQDIPGSEAKPNELAKISPAVGKTASEDSKPVAGLTKNASRKPHANKVPAERKVSGEKMKELALASHSTYTKATSIEKAAVPSVTDKALSTKLPLKSHATVDRKKNGIAATAVKVDPTKVAAAKNIASSKIPIVASAASNGQKPVAGTLHKTAKAKSGTATNNSVENVTQNATAANVQKEKRVIQKLVLYEHEHYIKTDPNNGYFNLDTISMQTLTQDLAVAEENSPALPTEKTAAARKSAPVTNNNTPANKSVASNGNIAGSTTAAADPQILPGASASSNGKPAMGQKENATGSKSSGAGALGSLENSFNDIKYKVNGVQFAAGLTAGINGTFFGPSSFNGFQFGVTGDFVFSDEWSFAPELKYFQRANSNYSLNDNYTTYTQNPNGGYTMQQTTNTYSFSTLHSIEMPLIIRYTHGKFNLFIGGNLVYSFSINEGYAQQTPPPTTTTTNGNDTQPKIDPVTDFNSRFGLGCLFGVSYKITPNVTLDLRNVLTLWDNANSAGSKYVSDQVYKSPSLQLSLGYRLGGNKHKE